MLGALPAPSLACRHHPRRLRRRQGRPGHRSWLAGLPGGVNGLKKILGADDSSTSSASMAGRHPRRHPHRRLRRRAPLAAPGSRLRGQQGRRFRHDGPRSSASLGRRNRRRVVRRGFLVAYKLVDIVVGLRVPEDEEREGLDLTAHGETAYHH